MLFGVGFANTLTPPDRIVSHKQPKHYFCLVFFFSGKFSCFKVSSPPLFAFVLSVYFSLVTGLTPPPIARVVCSVPPCLLRVTPCVFILPFFFFWCPPVSAVHPFVSAFPRRAFNSVSFGGFQDFGVCAFRGPSSNVCQQVVWFFCAVCVFLLIVFAAFSEKQTRQTCCRTRHTPQQVKGRPSNSFGGAEGGGKWIL